MRTYAQDRSFADAYVPAFKRIIAPLVLEEADIRLDTQQATDLTVLTARDLRIGCRVRSHGYADRYPWDFTLRKRRDSGAETEFLKIVQGWGDLLVYGHASWVGYELDRWFVINLDAFRAALILDDQLNHHVKTTEVPNGDGTYHVPIDVRMLPDGVVVGSSHKIPTLGGVVHLRHG